MIKSIIVSFMLLLKIINVGFAEGIAVSLNSEGAYDSGNIYGLIEKQDGKWRLIKVDEVFTTIRENDKQEILFISGKFDKVGISFANYNFECSPLADKMLKKNLNYCPCNSLLTTTCPAKSLGKNVVAAITTFGIAAGYWVEIDEDKVLKAVQESGFVDVAKEKKKVRGKK